MTITNIIAVYPWFPPGCPCRSVANSTNPFQISAWQGGEHEQGHKLFHFFQRQFCNPTVHMSMFLSEKQNRQKWKFYRCHFFFHLFSPPIPKRMETQNLVRDRQERFWWCQLKHARYLEEDKRSGNTREETSSFRGQTEGAQNVRKRRQENGNHGPGLSVYTHTLHLSVRDFYIHQAGKQ